MNCHLSTSLVRVQHGWAADLEGKSRSRYHQRISTGVACLAAAIRMLTSFPISVKETELFPCAMDLKKVRSVTEACASGAGEDATQMSKRVLFLTGLALVLVSRFVSAQPKYDPGASDTEIKIGNVAPYSGPVSLYGTVGKVEAAFFKMVNDQGGINGRKIDFISYDDAYSPPKTLEQTRRLVESDEVLLIFSPVGAPTNSAIQKYLNAKKIPHLFLASASTKWDDPKHFPWTMGMGTSYQSEGAIFARYIQRERPDAKVAVLYQNDDFGRDMLKGFVDALGEKGSMIVAKSSYEVSERQSSHTS